MAPNTKPTKSSQQTVVNDSSKDNDGSRSGKRVTRPTKTTAAKASKAGKLPQHVRREVDVLRHRFQRNFVLRRGPPVAVCRRRRCNVRKMIVERDEAEITTTSKTQGREPRGSTFDIAGEQEITYHSDVDGDSLNVNGQQSHELAKRRLLGMVVGCKPWGLCRIVNVAIPSVDSFLSLTIASQLVQRQDGGIGLPGRCFMRGSDAYSCSRLQKWTGLNQGSHNRTDRAR